MMRNLHINRGKFISKLLVFLLIFDLFMFVDISLNGPAFAAPVINEMSINTTDNEVSVSGTGHGNDVELADKPYRYTIGPSQSEWVGDTNITISETLTSGTLSNTQILNNSLTLAPATVSGGSIEVPLESGLEGFAYMNAIAVNHAQIDSELTDFPVTVYLDENNFDFSKCKPDGSDIRFTDKNFNSLKFERVEHQNGSKDLYDMGIKNTAFELITTSDGTNNIVNSSAEQAGSVRLYATKTNTSLGNKSIIYKSKEPIDLTNITTLSVEFSAMVLNNAYTSNNLYVGVIATNSPYTNANVNGGNTIFLAKTGTVVDGAKTMSVDVSAINQCAYIVISANVSAYYALGIDATITKISFDADYSANAHYNVLIPNVSDHADTEFYMFYGNLDAYNTSIEAWQDQTGKVLTYNGNVKLAHGVESGKRVAAFDGNGDYLDAASILQNNVITVEFWANIDFTKTHKILFDCGSHYRLCIIPSASGQSQGSVTVYIGNGTSWVTSFTSSSTLTEGLNHIAVVTTGTGTYLYFNGFSVGSSATSPTISANLPIRLGSGLYSGSAEYLNGYVYGCRITQRARYTTNFIPPTSFEIDGSDVVFCTNFDTIYDQNYAMVHHMGGSLVDATGNGNNGTATGTMVVGTEYGKARSFNGSTNNIIIPTPSVTSQYSELIMFKSNVEFASNPPHVLVSGSTATNINSFGMVLGPDIASLPNKMRFTPVHSSTELQSITQFNMANHYVMGGIYNGNIPISKLFINGELEATNSSLSGNVNLPVSLMLGKLYNTTVQSFNGLIDEYRILSVQKSDAWIKAESLSLKNELLSFASYSPTGSRESVAYDIFDNIASSKVEWTENKPTGTSIAVESNVSLNGGASWLGWKPCINGASISDLSGSADASNARLKLRQTLSTSSGAIVPTLSNSIITIWLSKYIHRIDAEPNNAYAVLFEVKDINNDITSSAATAYTKAQTPQFTVSNATVNTVDLSFTDDNPEDTEYQIICDSRYINSSGVLTSVPTWITLENKEITVLGLNVGTMYNFLAKARNQIGEETDFGSPVYTGTQGIPAPTGSAIITASALNNSITISWGEMEDALSYELEMDGIIKNVGNVTYCIHKDLMTGTLHTYRVRGKNPGGYSDWSEMLSVSTTSNLPLMPDSVLAKASDDTVTVYWNPAQDALTYTVEIGGTEITDVKQNSACLFGLEPETAYSYRVKSCNLIGESEWTPESSVTTYFLETPVIIFEETDSHEIKIGWGKIEGAVSYRITLDADDDFDVLNGSALEEFASSPAIIYTHADLPIKTAHVYKVRAESPDGDSAWSDAITLETLPERPDIPDNFRGSAAGDFITLLWDAVQDATGYDIEVDGIVVENDEGTEYQYKGLDQYTAHTYRIRAVTDEIEGFWSRLLTISTLGGIPAEPENVVISNVRGIAVLDWEKTNGALYYDVEVDGTVYSNIPRDSFTHRMVPLAASSSSIYAETAYRIRSGNDLGKSDWTDTYVNNAIRGQIEKGKELELGLTASNITDFSRYILNVDYNDKALTVTDLCAYSAEKELAPGIVEGHDIEIVSFRPGHIIFKVNKIIDEGYLWTGIINNIKFTGNATGGTTLTYTAQCLKD